MGYSHGVGEHATQYVAGPGFQRSAHRPVVLRDEEPGITLAIN